MEKAERVFRYPKASNLLLGAGLVAFCSTILLLISFCSPYWLESYQEANSEFIRLGLWDVCFRNYRHPSYQYDETFDGCHWIHSFAYQNIRDWLLPGWLMFVQSMMALALIFALLALIFISILLMRYMLRFEIIVLIIAFILEAITSVPVFLAIAVFGGMCFERSWLQYPTYNHLSWAYALAVVAFFFHAVAAMMLLLEAFKARERRRRANNLIYNMQPRS
uniref:Putative conserved plasma membrane protein n=1 Tax=Ornithodoros turicata TaxID=34597 RepID=A0A2R5L4K8_9ACAR